MKTAAMGLVLIAVLAVVACLVAPAEGVPGRPPAQSDSAGTNLIVFTTSVDDRRAQVVMVDPATRVMSVYHIDRSTGENELKSVRNCYWDFQMEYFNNRGLLPNQIRSQAEPR